MNVTYRISYFAMTFICMVDLEGENAVGIRAYDREEVVTFTLFVQV